MQQLCRLFFYRQPAIEPQIGFTSEGTTGSIHGDGADREGHVSHEAARPHRATRRIAEILPLVSGLILEGLFEEGTDVNATEKTYLPATKRYDQGIGDYPGVLDTQRSLYGRQRILLTLRPAKQVNQVNLYTVPDGGVDGGHASEVTKK